MTFAMSTVESPPLYASFPRRIQAVMLDALLLIAVFLAASSLAASVPGATGRWINIATLLVLVLYEPVLVWRWGGTLGHRALNLRVVHDGDGGRLPFTYAFARSLLKAVFGIFSFLVMMVTARHQALHDLVAHATVQVRDPSRAHAYDFVPERADEPLRAMPSVLRRALVTVAWEVALYFAVAVMAGVAVPEGCLNGVACGTEDEFAARMLGVVWLIAAVAAALLGYTGRLPGARARMLDAPAAEVQP
jgi:uncharacterized RDD family membrane protein YckC